MSDSSLLSTGGDTASEGLPEPVEGGQKIGKYRLCFELAAGGMGTVYLARADGPHGYEKLVALKRIHPHLAKDPKFVAMFLDEARIAARISHPSVCGVIDFGESDGTYYFAMPYIIGEPLTRVRRRLAKRPGTLIWEEAPFMFARLIADACEGLHAAHELKDADGTPLDVVHRDVSPHNLLVGYDGATRVLDFGVASASRRLHSTVTGEVKGKFAYIAPEQLDGEGVDRRADIWSLGVVLWECLALKRLFGAKSMSETVKAVLTRSVPAIDDLRPGVPHGLEEILSRALSRDAEGRYSTARAMGRDLNDFLVQQGRSIAHADVADWMDALFPNGREEKRRLVADAKASVEVNAILEELPQLPVPDPVELARTGAVRPTSEPIAATTPARHRGVFIVVGAAVLASVLTVVGLRYMDASSEDDDVPPTASSESSGVGPVVRDDAPGEEAAAAASDGDEHAIGAQEHHPDEAIGHGGDANDEAGETAGTTTTRVDMQPRARGPGTLTVSTPGGWGIVFAGGRRLGEAPGSFRLPAGRHTIEVQPFGRGARVRRRVRVSSGRTARVAIPVSAP